MEFIYKESLSNWIENYLEEGVFATDNELKIILWNRWLEERSKIPTEKVLGKRVFEVFPEIMERKADSYLHKALNGQPSMLSQRFHRYLLPLPPPDDFISYFARMQQTVYIAPLLSGMDVIGTITMIEDVTERVYREIILKREAEACRKAEEAAKRERDLAQHYLDVAGVIMLILDKNGNIVLINKKGCEILGYTQEELIGKNWFDAFIMEYEREQVKAAFESLMRGETIPFEEYENFVKTRDKGARIIHWNNVILRDAQGNITGTLSSGEDITEKRKLEDALRAMAITDELTGLYNRRGFMTLATQQVKIAQRAGDYMLLFFADLDNMKWINDTLGHKVDDEALKKAARILKETFRESDIIARMGGDEFAILAIDAKDTVANIMCERLGEKIDFYNNMGNDGFELSMSIGYARFDPAIPKTLDELIEVADAMMYEDKKSKKEANNNGV